MNAKTKTQIVPMNTKEVKTNMILDVKLTKKDIIDTIINEELYDLEDAVEAADKVCRDFENSPVIEKAYKKANKVVETKAKASIKTIQKALEKHYGKKATKVVANNNDYQNRKTITIGDGHLAYSCFGIAYTLELYFGDKAYHHFRFSMEKKEAMALKEVKALEKEIKVLESFNDACVEARSRHNTFKKQSKRASTAFIRQALSESGDGQNMNDQMDIMKAAIKERSKNLLKK